jgi:hypothetical protein
MGKSVPQRAMRTGSDFWLAAFSIGNDIYDRTRGLQPFYCNACNKRIILDGMSEPPNVCVKCGEEFYWEAIGKPKICPTCKRGFDISAEFCGYCTPSVKLEKGDS